MTKKDKKNKKIPRYIEQIKRSAKIEEPKLSDSNFVLDFSFEGLYYSVKHSDFSNFLANKDEFISHFRNIRNLNSKLSHKHKFEKVRNNDDFHCHTFDNDRTDLAIKLIKKAYEKSGGNIDGYVDQLIGGEKIYQIGYEGSLRLIGFYDSTRAIFKVCLIDYWHKLYYDEKYNLHSKKDLKFCPMTNDIKN